jgi:hypothetical protein
VYDPDENGIDVSQSTSDGASPRVTAESAGTHYIEVYGYQGASSTHNLAVDTEWDDQFEDNDETDRHCHVRVHRTVRPPSPWIKRRVIDGLLARFRHA